MDWYTVTAHASSRVLSGRTVLMREQRGQLEIKHHQDWTTEKQREQLENNHRGN
jgi:hypothetical protein